MITTKWSTGLRMFKAEYKGLSAIGVTEYEAIMSVTKLYNSLPNHKREELV